MLTVCTCSMWGGEHILFGLHREVFKLPNQNRILN